MSIQEIITCDECGNPIVDKKDHINARVYGADFHLACLTNMTALRLMKRLELDEIKDSNNDKFIYTTQFKNIVK